MKTTSNKSGGNGLINAPEFLSGTGALRLTDKVVDELAIFRAVGVVVAVAGEGYNVSVEQELRE